MKLGKEKLMVTKIHVLIDPHSLTKNALFLYPWEQDENE